MSWLISTLSSSVGKKLVMAVTGLFFCGFLMVHLAGNLTVYGGMAMFNSYVDHLHALGPLISVAEIVMVVLALIHVITGLTLAWENYSARPVRYQVNKSGGGRTLGSSTMPYTGLIVLLFVLAHLMNFHFADHTHRTVYEIMDQAFSDPVLVWFYVACMVAVGVHVSHGFWSAFQTLGLNHDKYNPAVKGLALIFSITVGLGFGSIPIILLFFI